MKIKITPEIFQKNPDFKIVGLKINGFTERDFDTFNVLEACNQIAINETIATNAISAWKSFHKENGSNKKARTSIEYLYKKITTGGLPVINGVVDLYNFVSIKHLVPLGGEDVDKIGEALILKYALGHEQFTPLLSTKNELPDKGEMIWSTANDHVVCRSLNWIESDNFKIDATSKAVVFISEVPSSTFIDAESCMLDLIDLVKHYSPNCTCDLISLNQSIAEVDV